MEINCDFKNIWKKRLNILWPHLFTVGTTLWPYFSIVMKFWILIFVSTVSTSAKTRFLVSKWSVLPLIHSKSNDLRTEKLYLSQKLDNTTSVCKQTGYGKSQWKFIVWFIHEWTSLSVDTSRPRFLVGKLFRTSHVINIESRFILIRILSGLWYLIQLSVIGF